MKRLLGYGSCLASTTLLAIVAQPALATSTMITGIQIVPTDVGAQIVLQTEDGATPQVFAVNQGSMLRADIVRTQLQLPDGNQFMQQNPAPGIAAIALTPLDGNSVRLTVEGSDRIPTGTVGSSVNGGVIIDVTTRPEGAAAPQASTPVPAELETVSSDESILIPVEQSATIAQSADTSTPQETAQAAEPAAPQPDVLIPNPQVIIDGVPVDAPEVQSAPPFLPAAVPPPVGDIAVSEVVPDFGAIDLGTTERVPRLVLRDAPSREVLNLLARAAGLNLVFIDADTGEESDGAATGTGEGPPITLDIENESVQDVFNSVLRVTGLQANRVGRTIYVGSSLPVSARNVTVRTLRLNQVDATVASNFLVGLGAESAVSRERQVTVVDAVEVSEGAPALTQTQTTTEERVETQRAEFEDSVPIFRGLQVIAEERTNSITLVGSPSLVELATSQLVRLDLRRRQVAINVKVIDIDLSALDALGTSFSFGNNDYGLANTGGLGIFNLGNAPPASSGILSPPTGAPISPSRIVGGAVNTIAEDFLLQVFGTVEDGSGKILTDPTLIVQEGQQASVQLTEEVIVDIDIEIETTDAGIIRSVTTERGDSGLVLQIDVDRIDDNGFVSFSVAPTITAPSGTVTVPDGEGGQAVVTLLAERQIQSGLVRVRDGQTLLLSGIIQETERTSVTKVPILGDLPLLGSLFRSTINETDRRELIVILTPEILDDSDQSTFGYSYTPSEEVQEIIERSR